MCKVTSLKIEVILLFAHSLQVPFLFREASLCIIQNTNTIFQCYQTSDISF